jgi:hypothetical protein
MGRIHGIAGVGIFDPHPLVGHVRGCVVDSPDTVWKICLGALAFKPIDALLCGGETVLPGSRHCQSGPANIELRIDCDNGENRHLFRLKWAELAFYV